jgi:hypothetical protein
MNAAQQVMFAAFGWVNTTERFSRMGEAFCRLCARPSDLPGVGVAVGRVRHPNALARTSKLYGLLGAHVRAQHPEAWAARYKHQAAR